MILSQLALYLHPVSPNKLKLSILIEFIRKQKQTKTNKMHLYNLTLSDSSLSSSMAVSGNFTGTSANEVCVASPTCISLFSTANNGGDKMRLIQKVPTYAVVRQVNSIIQPTHS